jgi:uncharacterized membrane protein
MNFKPIKHFIHIMFQGLFWLLPIVAILIILSWLYGKITMVIGKVFRLIGFAPESYEFLWGMLAISTFLVILYILGWFVRTRLANLFEYIFCKIPGYSTIKGLVGIFNSSKEGKNQVLVVAIKGFAKEGYNIGLMYSQKESIIKDHYTVTLSMSPIPNGGFMFEVHKEKILVIENANFDDNLQYLLSMGVKSFADIIKTEPKELDELLSLETWLEQEENKRISHV